MKKWLIIFITFILITPFVCDRILYWSFRSSNSNSRLADRLQRDPPQIVAIGSSRTSAALRSDGFEQPFMSVTTALMDIHLMDLVVRHFAETLKKSKLVMLELTVESLISDVTNNRPEVFTGLTDLGIAFYERPSLVWSKQTINFSLLVPHLIRHRHSPRELHGKWVHRHLKAKSRPEVKVAMERGFRPHWRQAKPKQLASSIQAKISGLKEVYRPDILEKGLHRLDNLMTFLRRQGINFCLVELPMASDFTRLLAQHFARAHQLVHQHYRDHGCLQKRLGEEHFTPPLAMADPDHIEHQSALRFSRYVSEALSRRN